MSVINNVLNELDKRDASSTHGKYQAKARKGLWQIILIIAVALMFVLLCFIVIYRFVYVDSNNISNIQIESTVKAPVKNVDNTANEEKNNDVAESNVNNAKDLEVKGTIKEQATVTVDKNIQEQYDSSVNNAKNNTQNVLDLNIENEKIKSIAKDESPNDDYAEEQFFIEELPNPEPTIKQSYIKVTEKKFTGQQEIEYERKQANTAMAKGNPSGAIDAYSSILAKNPRDYNAREKLAALYYGKDKTLDAIKVLDRGIELSPEHYDYRLYLARIYSSINQNSQAVKVLALGNPPVEKNVDYYATLATLARNNGDNTIAEQAYRKLSTISGKQGKWYMGLGLVLEEQKKFNEAKIAYLKSKNLYLSTASKNFVEQRIKYLETMNNDRK